MIEKVVKKIDLKSDASIKENLAYWLSKTPGDRIAAIEFLRRQYMEVQQDFRNLLALLLWGKTEFGGYDEDYTV